MMITVKINGEKKSFERTMTLEELLKKLKLDRRLVVVELNYKVMKKELLDKVSIRDKDNIEIVHFVGGGI